MEYKPLNIRTLLILVLYQLENSKNEFNKGLCWFVFQMCNRKIINDEELMNIQKYIKDNRPKWYQKDYSFKQRKSSFYWKIGDRKPRIQWLKSQINKIKD